MFNLSNRQKVLNEIDTLLQKRKPKQVEQKQEEIKPVVVKEDAKPVVVKEDNKNKQTSVVEDIKHVMGKDDSDYAKVTDLLLNEKFKRRKTVLKTKKEVSLLTALDVISQIYDIPFLKQYIDYRAQWLTSIDAKGRNDIVDISKFRFEEQNKFNSQILELARGNR